MVSPNNLPFGSAVAQTFAHYSHCQPNQPATGNPEGNCPKQLLNKQNNSGGDERKQLRG
jgi:hypothetical protein